MLITINHAADEPIYLQIRSQIINAIANGGLPAGTRLPAVRQLAADLGINLHTANKAYAVLRDEGYITMKSRCGAIVSHRKAQASDGQPASLASEKTREQVGRLIAEHKAAGRSAESFVAMVQSEIEKAYGEASVSPSSN